MGDSHRILIIGSGGREHALAWRLSRDPGVERVTVTPGNDGIHPPLARRTVPAADAAGLIALCRAERITLAVIGPEGPLASGLADTLRSAGNATYGPSRAAARLEASKWDAKQVMMEAGIPTAYARAFTTRPAAVAALDDFGPPWVLKADGLASGKGVLVTARRDEAERFLAACLEQDRFGEAGRRVVLEEHLSGEESSLMAICDGTTFRLLPAARDHKRAFDGDQGPNTGGMGAVAPDPGVDAAGEREIGERIVRPALAAMIRRGAPFQGTLYVGLMRTALGPKVVEFNCRFGDPETQAVMPLVTGDLAGTLAAAAASELGAAGLGRDAGAAVAVAIVAQGYPEASAAEGTLEGLEALMGRDDLWVFHAGLARAGTTWRLTGGRAVHVVARADTLAAARGRVYDAIATLGGRGWRCRADIGAASGPGAAAHGLKATVEGGGRA